MMFGTDTKQRVAGPRDHGCRHLSLFYGGS